MKGNSLTTCSGAGPDNEVMIGRTDIVNQLRWWIGIDCGTGNFYWLLRDSNGGLDEVILEPDPALNPADGQWHHIVGVRDADPTNNKVYLYVDGNEVDVEPAAFSHGFESTADLNLGWFDIATEFYFNGTLDEIAIYDRALTETEVGQHFAAEGGPRYCVDLDSDGISDGEENAGPNSGDGNSDTIPDMNQNTVASLLTINGGTEYVTLETSAGTLANCGAVANPSAGDEPPDTTFPWGFFNFTIS